MAEVLTQITPGEGYIEIRTTEERWAGSRRMWYREQASRGETTVWNLVSQALDKHADRDFLGFRAPVEPSGWSPTFTWKKYGEVRSAVNALGSGLFAIGLRPGSKVAMLMPNCPSWLCAEFALERQALVSVPLYTTFGEENMAAITRIAEIGAAFCSPAMIDSLTAVVSKGSPVRMAILTEPVPPSCEAKVAAARAAGIEVRQWQEVIDMGNAAPVPAAPCSPADVWTVVFSSGTTGEPRGSVITHRTAVVGFNSMASKEAFNVLPEVNTFLSYLPLSHVFERNFLYMMTLEGSMIGFSCGDMRKLTEDLAALRPTFMIGVPRVWKKIYDSVMEKINSSWIARHIFNHALSAKASAEAGGFSFIDWDKRFFSKFRAKIGGRCKLIISGSAPLSGELATWFRRVFGVDVHQGYGLTESWSPLTISSKAYRGPGPFDVGIPSIACEGFRLIDAPELGYRTTDKPSPRGEICVRGMFSGYLNNPQATEQALTPDGVWFKTGDVATLNPDGSLMIIDRIKSVFKLACGEFVPAEQLETIFSESTLVSQIWVHGDPSDSAIVAVVVPNVPTLARALGKDPQADPAATCSSPEARSLVLSELTKICRSKRLPGFMVPKAVLLDPEPFSANDGTVTPTFKLRRRCLLVRYASQMPDLRKQAGAATSSSLS